jgi:hypothetical protein
MKTISFRSIFSTAQRSFWNLALTDGKTRDDLNVIRESGLFDEQFYLRRYEDVRQSGMDPLVHYVRYGAMERRNPNPYFHTPYYLGQCPEAAACRINPLRHFIEVGAGKRLSPSPFFDTAAYLEENPEVAASGVNPLLHYIRRKGDDVEYLPSEPLIQLLDNFTHTGNCA